MQCNGLDILICSSACARTPFNTVKDASPTTLVLLICLSGLPRTEPAEDPHLGSKRSQLVTVAARKLADARMIAFDSAGGALTITDLGRIAAKYYIRHSSIEIFNEVFRPRMTEADVLAMLSRSTEVRRCLFCLLDSPGLTSVFSLTKYKSGSPKSRN